MIISTSSWHYRLLKKLDFEEPCTLCTYFWKVVWAVVIVGFVVPFTIVGMGLDAYAFFMFEGTEEKDVIVIMVDLLINKLGWWSLPLCLGMFLGMFGWILAGVMAAFFIVGGGWVTSVYAAGRVVEKLDIGDKTGLFRSWVRARKQQVCPIIEYQDETDEEANV